MAMSGTVLRNLIDTKMAAANSDYAASPERANIKNSLGAIAEAIVEHITTQATITVSVTSVSAVTAGVGVSGPGTGTATIL